MTLENYTVRNIASFPAKGFTGRRKIKTPVKKITADNVRGVVEKALAIHSQNAAQIDYLWNVYTGSQDIQKKEKYVRKNINNKVTVNRANEIVTFKTAFLLEEPIQYISHGGDDNISKLVNQLNEYMRAANKEANDKSVVDWFHICGVAPRLALVATDEDDTTAPFCDYSLDPRKAFCIYYDGLGEKRLAGVILGVDENEETYADVYTKDTHYVIKGNTVEAVASPQYSDVPLVEYINNEARIGAFEVVLPLLNAINTLESNALDSIQDFVNGFDVFSNCEIADGDYSKLSLGGQAVMIKTTVQGMEAKVYRVASELSQEGVQERIDDLTSAYLEICGMPNRNGGSSTSDTGTAVLFRDGWSAADSRAKDTITLFRRSEREFDKIVLGICKVQGIEVPELADFEPEFPRGNLTNMQSKTQVLCEMLNNPKIHPKYAFSISGLFDDAEEAYRVSSEYYEANKAEQEERLNEAMDEARTAANAMNAEFTNGEANEE